MAGFDDLIEALFEEEKGLNEFLEHLLDLPPGTG